MNGWIFLIAFLISWIGFAILASRIFKSSSTIAYGGGFIFGCICLIVVAMMLKPNQTGESTKEPQRQLSQAEQQAMSRKQRIESQFSAWDGSHRELEKLIKNSMNAPDSYKHVETKYWDQGDPLIVMTKFRGKNAFGGVITNWVKAKVSLDGNILEVLEQN